MDLKRLVGDTEHSSHQVRSSHQQRLRQLNPEQLHGTHQGSESIVTEPGSITSFYPHRVKACLQQLLWPSESRSALKNTVRVTLKAQGAMKQNQNQTQPEEWILKRGSETLCSELYEWEKLFPWHPLHHGLSLCLTINLMETVFHKHHAQNLHSVLCRASPFKELPQGLT